MTRYIYPLFNKVRAKIHHTWLRSAGRRRQRQEAKLPSETADGGGAAQNACHNAQRRPNARAGAGGGAEEYRMRGAVEQQQRGPLLLFDFFLGLLALI